MKTIKKITGVLFVSSPFIGLGILCGYTGRLLELLITLVMVAVLLGVLWLGVKLMLD